MWDSYFDSVGANVIGNVAFLSDALGGNSSLRATSSKHASNFGLPERSPEAVPDACVMLPSGLKKSVKKKPPLAAGLEGRISF